MSTVLGNKLHPQRLSYPSRINEFLFVLFFLLSNTTTVCASTLSSPTFGGTGGAAFTDTIAPNQKLTGITLRGNWWIDSIQGQTNLGGLPVHGTSTGGNLYNITWPANEYLVRIYGRYGALVGQISFVTNTGRVYGPYGIAQTLYLNYPVSTYSFNFSVPAGNAITGFTGRSGLYVDSIGVTYNPIDVSPPIASLKGISPPSVPGLLSADSSRSDIITPIVVNKTAAIALGKALFWDQALGSDGMACASCHFQAGVDNRTKNTINPGFNHNNFVFNTTRSGSISGPNYTLRLSDFPFNPSNDDSVSSQGVFQRKNFRPGDANSNIDICSSVADPVFNVKGITVRQVEPRNTPTMINAAYNFRNFWDGRANNIFNGVNPFGMRDTTAGVFINTSGGVAKKQLNLKNSSLASQAVGPILSLLEMSCDNRKFADVGRKILDRRPLANQTIHPQDSVLSSLPGLIGSNGRYSDLVRLAFNNAYWSSAADFSGYTHMQANFSMLFGLAVQLYEATLISDDSKFDRWKSSQASLTSQEQQGHDVFTGKGKCSSCHSGPVFTSAAIRTNSSKLIERMYMKDSLPALYDEGFYNLGLVPNDYDIGLGGKDPFGNPLSFSKQYQTSLWVDPFRSEIDACKFELPLSNCSSPSNLSSERVAVDGSFKVPTLRNIALTGPYFHNGSKATLEQVVEFYDRGGDFNNVGKHPDIEPLGLSSSEQTALVAFLKTLTDDRVAYEKAPFDHPSLSIPHGHTGNSSAVSAGNTIDSMLAVDEFLNLPAVGSSGRTSPLRAFHETLAP